MRSMRLISVIKRLLIILFVFAVVIVAAGLYQGWFTLSSPERKQGGKTNVNLEIDAGKFRQDAEALSTKAKEIKENVTGSNQGAEDK